MADHAVIVGASLAGLRAAEALRHAGHDGPLTVVGDEAHRPYDRPPLSKQVLTGKVDAEGVALPADDSLDVEWVLGAGATGLDVERRLLLLGGRGDIHWDRLVIATGAQPRVLPGVPAGPGVHYLRTLDDSLALRDDLTRSAGLAVIGAGFIGLEVASSAHQMGVPVTVIEALPVPLEGPLGPQVGRSVMEWHRSKGVDIRPGVKVETVVGPPEGRRPERLLLDDGSEVVADTVVVGIGVTPATAWLVGSGLDVGDGVLCDERLRVLRSGRPLPHVVAAGDVARWRHPSLGDVRVEHWTNAAESAEAAAHSLLRGDGADPYAPVPYFWSDQHGMKLQFVGKARPDDEIAVLEGGFEEDRLLIAYGRRGHLVGALGLRRAARVMALQRLIGERAPFPPSI